MILKQGIIALIQFFLKLPAAFLRNFPAGFIEKTEPRVEDAPPVVALSFSEDETGGIVGAAGDHQIIVDSCGKPGAFQGKRSAIGYLLFGKKTAGGSLQAGFVFEKPAGNLFLAVCAFRQVVPDIV